MEEGERKLCLAEPPLELKEETPLQVQMQILELVEDREALAAEVVLEEEAEWDTFRPIPSNLDQEQMEVLVGLAVMEAAVEQGV